MERSVKFLVIAFVITICTHCSEEKNFRGLDHTMLAKQYYGDDDQWYLNNIPFFECSDKEIEQVYYYRWKMYKAHIRNVGDNSFVITEFM